MSKPPDRDFFRTLADHSESGLLTLLTQLANEKKTSAVLEFAHVLAERGTTGPIFDKGEPLEIKTLGEFRVQFTHALSKALAPLEGDLYRNSAWSSEQREIFDLTAKTLMTHSRGADLLSQFAFNLASTVQDPEAFKRMSEMGVNFITQEKTRLKGSYATVPVFVEAIYQGNTSAALALMPMLTKEQAASCAREIERGVKATNGAQSTTFDAAEGLLKAMGSTLKMQATGGGFLICWPRSISVWVQKPWRRRALS